MLSEIEDIKATKLKFHFQLWNMISYTRFSLVEFNFVDFPFENITHSKMRAQPWYFMHCVSISLYSHQQLQI